MQSCTTSPPHLSGSVHVQPRFKCVTLLSLWSQQPRRPARCDMVGRQRWGFTILGVPYQGPYCKGILLLKGLYWGPPIFVNPQVARVSVLGMESFEWREMRHPFEKQLLKDCQFHVNHDSCCFYYYTSVADVSCSQKDMHACLSCCGPANLPEVVLQHHGGKNQSHALR